MSTYPKPVYVVKALRTAVTKAQRGAFAHERPDNLLAHTIKAVVKSLPKVDPTVIGDVMVGCAMPEGMQGLNVARIAALMAGLPDRVPGMTVNRFCSSGVQTIALAANAIALGQAELILAGGVESMSQVPMGGFHPSGNPKMFVAKGRSEIAYSMGVTAEIVADQWSISREAQDQFAYDSHQKALQAQTQGLFGDEITPYSLDVKKPNLTNGQVKKTKQKVVKDEGPRADTSVEALAKLKPAFAVKGSVTAGNSSQVSDGAAMVMVASEQALQDFKLEPVGQILGYCVCGVDPKIMGIGPVQAIRDVLDQTGLSLDQIDWIELNEAFAAQSLAVIKEANLDVAKVNPRGGAIALGHPLGATGAIRMATILSGLKQTGGKLGLITMCIGTGMGAAMVVAV